MTKQQMLEQQTFVIRINQDPKKDAFQSATNTEAVFAMQSSSDQLSSFTSISTSESVSGFVSTVWHPNVTGSVSISNPSRSATESILISLAQTSVTIVSAQSASLSASFFSYPHLEPTLPDHNIIQLEKERSAFLVMKTKLLANPEYREKYVAILQGKVIDSDAKLADLAKRVYAEHGYLPILMTKVTSKIRKFENSSPETRIS
jgi:hypothetical protein